MSELRIETWTMPGADVGPENPLPPLRTAKDVHDRAREKVPGIPDEMLGNMAYGHVPNVLPYTMQDRYTRQLSPRDFRVAVLENETLRATFLLEFGGRLWSLLHKPSGRELLETNPVFQPANLALRNAWFSGGVEWNIGMRGHCPFTCSSLFAARAMRDDGTPALRMYEWERIRQAPFQIDAYLPDGSPVLFVRVRIVNPHDREIPMYWWSNMAAPESTATRVLIPAESAYKFGYGKGGLGVAPVPKVEDVDITYTTNIDRSADFFFHIPDGRRPWITALDGTGRGVIQTSTQQLKGRKLFLWGMGTGGRRWQEFLSRPGRAYIEIQSGLARTQMEHLPMPAGAEWAWLEAYGLMEADADAVHGNDWSLARQAVEDRLEQLIPQAALDAEFERGAAFVDRAPAEVFQRGSGWGALERMRQESAGEAPFCPKGLVYGDESLDAMQAPWVALLQDGALGEADADAEPCGYMVEPAWREMLERAVAEGRGTHWFSWLHLGVMRYQAGERDAARQAWEMSVAQTETPWALRNLAVLAREDGNLSEAADLYVRACRMCPSLLPLAAECGQVLNDATRPQAWLDLLETLSEPVRRAGRIRLLEGWAALAARDFGRVENLLAGTLVIDDLREGERSLSHLWFEYHEQRLSAKENVAVDDALRERVRREFPVPARLDFRMSSDPPAAEKGKGK